jgi:hypothetical protein
MGLQTERYFPTLYVYRCPVPACKRAAITTTQDQGFYLDTDSRSINELTIINSNKISLR